MTRKKHKKEDPIPFFTCAAAAFFLCFFKILFQELIKQHGGLDPLLIGPVPSDIYGPAARRVEIAGTPQQNSHPAPMFFQGKMPEPSPG